MKYCFGIDIGGTTIKCGFFTVEGNLLEKWEIPTRILENGKYIFSDICETINKKLQEKGIDKSEVIGVGCGIPGPVEKDGHVSLITNLGLKDINPEKVLTELVKLPVKAGNDANVAALGEQWVGGGKGYSDLVMVTLGTGIGWGVIINGKILAGAHGAAGECGHMKVRDNEPETCGCGNKGCLEQYCSANGIVKEAIRKLKKVDTPSRLRELETVTCSKIFDYMKENDALATEIVDEWAQELAKGLAHVSSVVDPEAFIIGGGVSKAGQIVCDYLLKYYQPLAFHGNRGCKIELAKLGNDAGIYGAAKMVIE